MGSNDFKSGIESKLIINSKSLREITVYRYSLIISFKTPSHAVTKYFRLLINNIAQLNELNCLTVQFTDSKSLKETIKLTWLEISSLEVENMQSANLIDQNSFTSFGSMKDYGIETSWLSSSNAFGFFGGFNKSSYLSIRNFEIKNFETPRDEIEYNFKSINPNVYDFDKLESLNAITQPQLIDTLFGKSLLFSRYDQQFTIKNTSNSCFGNLDTCKNGYTLKIWVCFTNYNLMRITQNRAGYSNQFNLTKNLMKKVYLLQNGQKNNHQGIVIYYDSAKNQLVTLAKTSTKWFKSEINFKIKFYSWYTITVSWDKLDGLRMYINNKMLDHTIGFANPNQMTEEMNENEINEFNIGKSDFEFDWFPSSESSNSYNFVDNLIIETNQTEDRDKISKIFLNKRINSLMNNYYYEFIIHKLIQYDVRKYPDEIIPKSIIFQGKI